MRWALGMAAAMAAGAAHADEPLWDLSLSRQQALVAEGQTSSEAIARLYLERIGRLDRQGPRLNSIIAVNPRLIEETRALDAERRAGQLKGPLHGAAILLKDNIESADPLPTTAGSLALKDNHTGRDAPLVARLRAAGAVVLGKANLSEWANFRSTRSISGWSAIGGLTRNPYALDRTPCGSSAGSAVAVAAGLAAAAVGTETDGSVTCPASMNGIVGLKPTVGLVSRTHVVPIAASQDTPGPMTRTVEDAARLLAAMAGSDPADPATAEADKHRTDYVAALRPDALKGARLGVLRAAANRPAGADPLFEAALAKLREAGAELVEVHWPDETAVDAAETVVLTHEFKAGINAYLASAAPAVRTRSLDALIAFNAGEPRELALFGQELFETARGAHGLDHPTYVQSQATGRRLAGPESLDRMLREAKVEALVAITAGPASVIDPVNGSRWFGSPSTLPAVAGYPHLTVPMGQVDGLPVGLSFIGPAWSDARLLSLGYAFEQKTKSRRPPTFPGSVSQLAKFSAAFDPPLPPPFTGEGDHAQRGGRGGGR